MICSFKRLIYPQTGTTDGFMIGLYAIHDRVPDAQGQPLIEAKVVGYYLPVAQNLRYDLSGHWSKSAKHGVQFELETYQEIIHPTKTGIIAYLSSGLIKGVGPKTAERIYDMFGVNTLEVLDKEPEKLLLVSGVSKGKLERIRDSYLASRAARNVVALLAPHGVSANLAVRIFKTFGADTLSIIREHPYRLCEMHGIGFDTADRIACSLGLALDSPERVAAGLLHTLKDAELQGHLCLEKREFLQSAVKLLNTPNVTEQYTGQVAYQLLLQNQLELYNGCAYRAEVARIEQAVADRIQALLAQKRPALRLDLDAALDKEQTKLGLSLASEQRQAIKIALTSGICIISGGPGTGKTLIQRALLDLYRLVKPQGEVVCCAPTGRAARRMEQCTGFPASTIHKALGLLAEEDAEFNEPQHLDADLVLVDEVSMVDIYLAQHLLSAISPACQLVLVGDADQLPSVGPGAVLSEMIACGQIPVVKLDKVFRQNAGSRIAINAKLIRHNNLALEYGDDFILYESPDFAHSAELIEKLYLDEVAAVGPEQVALLTPYRKKTETGANALNDALQQKVNPPDASKPETIAGKRLFRLGDKVMQLKNCNEVSNGDVGYVVNIFQHDGETVLQVDFGDGRIVCYDATELDKLELAYASTIHKSQGSEYATVIVNIQSAHYIMLKRPLLYTAITRAKQKVIIVGERKAICMAIKRVDAEKRGTMLALRINEQATVQAAN